MLRAVRRQPSAAALRLSAGRSGRTSSGSRDVTPVTEREDGRNGEQVRPLRYHLSLPLTPPPKEVNVTVLWMNEAPPAPLTPPCT
ncbi:hypothetical protein EYF80_062751 [Liparis tanakae]|uniref:Uncharacterized protein n=1 Tax=Liparis tanakae TaxID=230148 RepID=A0A4Z2EEC8_9TELE|nr:hypothetical protein EYF80_062751 [Liparis tanakae]